MASHQAHVTEPTSYLVFSETLKPGQTRITRPVPDNFFLYGNYRNFRLSVLRIKPDFFDKEAHNLSLNPQAEEDHEDTYGTEIRLNFTEGWIEKASWAQMDQGHDTGSVLKSINQAMLEGTKVGAKYPHIIFDWVSAEFIDEATPEEKKDPTAWHVARRDRFWPPGDNIATNFNEYTHLNGLPENLRHLKFLNHMRFPQNMEDEEYEDEVRVRMHLGPHTMAIFSSETMISYLKLPPVPRGLHNQLLYKNSRFGRKIIEAEFSPEKIFRQGAGKHKLKAALLRNEVTSGPLYIKIAKKLFRDHPEEVASIMSKTVKPFSIASNVDMDVKYDPETKRFSFPAPGSLPNGYMTATMIIEPALAEKMGYGLVNSISGNSKALLAPPQDKEEEDQRKSNLMEVKAKALAYDVGMIAVTHENHPNRQTSQFHESVVGLAWPENPGVWTTEAHQAQFGPAVISFLDKKLDLAFHRFGEDGQPSALACPVNLCVQGIFFAEK